MQRTATTVARVGLSVCFALVTERGLCAQEDKLDQVKHEVHDKDEHHHDDGDDDLFDSILEGEGEQSWLECLYDETLGALVEYTLLTPFWLPRKVLEDENDAPGRFDVYPYRDGAGYWLLPDEVPSERRWSIRSRLEFGSDFDDLERVGLGLELEHVNRLGLDASWNRWHEDLSGGGSDEIDLGDVNLVYRFAQSESAAYRAGLGVNYFDDEIGDEFGFNLTYGAEFLPVRPLSVGFEIDYGALGEASLTHYRAHAGVLLERFELYASFDSFDVDGVVLRSYGVGLRGWF